MQVPLPDECPADAGSVNMVTNTNESSIAISFIICLFIFPLCKFFQNEVQFSVGSLTRPVTADQSCYRAGHHEYGNDDEDDLHHTSVPFNLPSTSATAMAEMNMPAMMYTKSI